MKPKVIQQVEDAVCDAVIDAASGLGLTPLQRAKFVVAISEVLLDAITPYVQHAEPDSAPAPRVRKAADPNVAKKKRRTKSEIMAANAALNAALNATQTTPIHVPPAPGSDVSQPAPFKGAPAAAPVFSG